MSQRISGKGANTEPVPVSDNGGSLTVDGPLTDTQLRATAVPVSAASLPLPSGAATAAKQDSQQTTLDAINAKDLSTAAKQDTGNTSLATIAAKDFATQTTLAALLTELQLKADLAETQPVSGPLTDAQLRATAVPVSASSLPLPSGAATAAKQDTLLAELQLKADLTETQPVSVASLPLPSGAATAAKQDLLLTELQLKADLTETQPVSVASLPLPSGAATAAKQDSLLTELQLKADLTETQPVSVASLPLPSGAATQATLADILTELGQKTEPANTQIVGDGGGSLTVDGPVTDAQLRATAVPVSAASLPLPSGAATSAKQDDMLAWKGKPAVADILCGDSTATGSPTIITVPANKVWLGYVTIAGSLRSTGLSDADVRATWTPGTGGTAAYAIGRVVLSVPAPGTGEGGRNEAGTATVKAVLYAGTTSGTITMESSVTPTQRSVCASGYVVSA